MFLDEPFMFGNLFLVAALCGGMIVLATAEAHQFTVPLGKLTAIVVVVVVVVLIVFLSSSLLGFLLFLVGRVPLVRGQRIQGIG